MINLLPPEEKQNLSEIRQRKIVLILGLVVLVFFVSLGLILASMVVSVSSQVAAQKILLNQKEEEFRAADTQNLEKTITQINQSLLQLDHFYRQRPSLVDFLEKISNLLPEGIYLTSISVNPLKSKNENNLFQVYLSGHALSVEEVIKLNENLKKDGTISQIYFPGQTWLEKENFSFSASFQSIIGGQ